jgi:AraC-like DNA-binding protein
MAPLLELPRILAEHGLDPYEFIRDAGCNPTLFKDPESTIDFVAVGRLFARTAAATGVECPGLELGRPSGLKVLGTVGKLMSFAPDFGTALRALILRFHLHDRGAVPSLWEIGSQTLFGYTVYTPEVLGTDHIYDAALAIAMNTFTDLLGKGWQPSKVRMFRQPPKDKAVFRRHFRAKLEFGMEHAALVFPSSDLERPVLTQDPEAYAQLHRKLEEVDRANNGLLLSNRIRRLIRGMLVSGSGQNGIDLPYIAKFLELHPRTLARRLRAEGETFRSILDTSRYQIARHLLRDTGLSISKISGLLGYAEPAAFNHAFRRWSDMSPLEWQSAEQINLTLEE